MALSVSLAYLYRKTGKTESPKFTHVPQRRSNQATLWFLVLALVLDARDLFAVFEMLHSSLLWLLLFDDDDFTLTWPQTHQ